MQNTQRLQVRSHVSGENQNQKTRYGRHLRRGKIHQNGSSILTKNCPNPTRLIDFRCVLFGLNACGCRQRSDLSIQAKKVAPGIEPGYPEDYVSNQNLAY